MKAIILAAGRGKRMRDLTADKPKPLIKLGEQTLIEYQIMRLKKAGITDIVINVSYQANKIIDYLQDGRKFGVKIQYSAEEQALETAGGIKNAIHLLGNDYFCAINSDIYLECDIRKFIDNMPSKSLGHLLMVKNPSWKETGDFAIDENNFLQLGDEYTFAGLSVLSPQLFDSVKTGEIAGLAKIFHQHIPKHNLTAELFNGKWDDIGTPERLANLSIYLNNQNKELK